MKITKEKIKSLNPCRSGWDWYCQKERTEDLYSLLLEINDNSPANVRWLFTNLMTKKQRVEIAIFSAREVLHIFEEKYPEDSRPREAVEAAEKWLKDPSEENRAYAAAAAAAADAAADAAAYAAAYAADAAAAYAAAAAAAAADAAAAAAAAAYAADAAAYAAADAAAYAAAYAADAAAAYAAAYAYVDAARKELQLKIIEKAVEILEQDNDPQ